ncbi:hypothetical protein BG07_1326 [Bacillus pseudomycoides]|nr:hypothetical protein DJ92_3619 [Bacillus pseudomycoides]AJI18143.1 hypothetical protein BG07_1326 [Bacillus pseudomycoides]
MGAPHHHQVNKNPPDAESIWRLCGSHLASHIYKKQTFFVSLIAFVSMAIKFIGFSVNFNLGICIN